MKIINENTLPHLIVSHLHHDFYIDFPSLQRILHEWQPGFKSSSLMVALSCLVKDGVVETRLIAKNAPRVDGKMPSAHARYEYTLSHKEMKLPPAPEITAWGAHIATANSHNPSTNGRPAMRTPNQGNEGKPYCREDIEDVVTRHNMQAAAHNRITFQPQQQNDDALHFSGSGETMENLASLLKRERIENAEVSPSGTDIVTLRVNLVPNTAVEQLFDAILSKALLDLRKHELTMAENRQGAMR